MDVISLVAGLRNTTEERVANDYTLRQLMHITQVYLKDKTLMLNMVSSAFAGRGKRTAGTGHSGVRAEGVHEDSTPGASGLPHWFGNPKPGYRVVSMDAPMPMLMSAMQAGRFPRR
jgi:hypothetical protein